MTTTLKEIRNREAEVHEDEKYKNDSSLDYYGVKDSFENGFDSGSSHMREKILGLLKAQSGHIITTDIFWDKHSMGIIKWIETELDKEK